MIIVDNVWESSKVKSWSETLSKIASYSGSATIVTTRFNSLCNSLGFDVIDLGRLDLSTEKNSDWRIAEDLYDALSKATAEVRLTEEYRNGRKGALILSCGLLLGISTFAGLVQSYREVGDDEAALLSRIEERINGIADRVVGEDLKASTGYHGIFSAMGESLAHLDKLERKDCGVKSLSFTLPEDVDENAVRDFRASYGDFPGKQVSSRYAALDVMPASSTKISFLVLRSLWNVPSVYDAQMIARRLANNQLGRIEQSDPAGQEELFCLNQLQYEYCVSLSVSLSTARVEAIVRQVTGDEFPFLVKELVALCAATDRRSANGEHVWPFQLLLENRGVSIIRQGPPPAGLEAHFDEPDWLSEEDVGYGFFARSNFGVDYFLVFELGSLTEYGLRLFLSLVLPCDMSLEMLRLLGSKHRNCLLQEL